MNKNLLYSLTCSLIFYNKLKIKNIKEVTTFINSQVNKMPDFFLYGVILISSIFDIVIFLIFFKRFYNLKTNKKIKIIHFIKKNNIPLFSLYIRLIESNALVKYFELNND